MEIITSAKPLFAILVSLIATILISITGEKARNLREAWTIIASIVKFTIVASMLPDILNGRVIEYTLLAITSELVLQFKVDAFGILFALTSSFLWIITSFYSIGYMRGHNEKNQTRYYACFAIALSTTMGVAFSANLFTMYLFYEGLTFATYPLVVHHETKEAKIGARKYVLYLFISAKLFLLTAIAITYYLAGTLDFQKGGIFTESVQKAYISLLGIVFLLYIYGFAKAAVMPLHSWLPAAMVAPTPVSALLHAVAVVKTGVFAVLKVIFYIYGVDFLKVLYFSDIGLFLAAFTIIMASIIALTKDNIKARLAYSTVSQLSYIILGPLLLTYSGMIGGIIHISNHAFAKITLFFCAGSLYVCAHKTAVSELDGIAKKMPWTMAAFTIGALGMIGIPLTGGFVTKWYLLLGSLEKGSIDIVIVLLLSSLLNAGYFLPIVYRAYFKEFKGNHVHHAHGESHTEIRENPFMAIPLTITAIISLIVGIYPDLLIQLAQEVLK
ncbi:MAG: monovalent cation/H+ antiporter subunit D family protein [Thermodesulfovibrio sp.]|uniref:monovalent cation/H+ antiporter subunit D family protein n=1 Tax=Thermodesulfovibrio sp. 1176 TaxID=3043424 RepID=UPI002482A726|nr:monovalent cation/H+ antiporter subunit D family protein [Thermodesulfovibrio sp. 1176]MDI1472255.1 monovalent cation/H+ antiporter subunit D family protein [Thermodesulfovibrio sp. 1176]MDI6714117.1 monovalent cation/H+ antiporter subunit D family protein [Thermodesulfovibrio sp.]